MQHGLKFLILISLTILIIPSITFKPLDNFYNSSIVLRIYSNFANFFELFRKTLILCHKSGRWRANAELLFGVKFWCGVKYLCSFSSYFAFLCSSLSVNFSLRVHIFPYLCSASISFHDTRFPKAKLRVWNFELLSPLAKVEWIKHCYFTCVFLRASKNG